MLKFGSYAGKIRDNKCRETFVLVNRAEKVEQMRNMQLKKVAILNVEHCHCRFLMAWIGR